MPTPVSPWKNPPLTETLVRPGAEGMIPGESAAVAGKCPRAHRNRSGRDRARADGDGICPSALAAQADGNGAGLRRLRAVADGDRGGAARQAAGADRRAIRSTRDRRLTKRGA